MNGTPRLRSAFPSTPQSGQKFPAQNVSTSGGRGGALPLPTMSSLSNQRKGPNAPLIPFDIVDAPSQRLYVSAFYLGLTAWRLYDYFHLVSNQTDSLWLFMKWVAIDGVFLYGLPGLNIPWLEWSSSTMTMLFLVHALLDGILMFRIPIPLEVWLGVLTKTVYDREIAVSERSVRPASIIHNASLILGKQIIHILPEGSAVLNPDQMPFCIDELKTSVTLPIRINQTHPTSIELLRIDLETNLNETLAISSKEVNRLKRQADKEFKKNDHINPRELMFPVRKTGLYRLQRVVDESKLEVQRRMSDTLVVRCPSASVKPVPQNKCIGQLSNFYLQIDATPPLKIKYSKIINREDNGFTFLTIHPENLISPLARQRTSGVLASLNGGDSINVAWARTQHIEIPLNETLGISGGWQYSIDEVHDACGNVANYSSSKELGQQRSSGHGHPIQTFTVHERPKVALDGCSPQKPLTAAKGRSRRLPLRFGSTGSPNMEPSQYSISYLFTPQNEMTSSGEHALTARTETFTLKDIHQGPEIREPGLYSLLSVSSEFCTGEVLEPSSCILLNPPEPDLVITAENIPDKCAGNAIGLMLDLDLIGTPPFRVSYNIHRKGSRVVPKSEKIDRLRAQLELKPLEAGHYTYDFLDISDAVYGIRSLKSKNLRLEQDVKPPASARFAEGNPQQQACIEEPVSFDVHMSGEAPWTLEYEVVHGGRRQKHKVEDIDSQDYTLWTGDLVDGGLYSLSLTSVTDKSTCKVFLEEEAKIEVRRQRPKASFGQIEGKRSALTLEAKKINLPLRLTGEPPWTVTYRNLQDPSEKSLTKQVHYTNDVLEAVTQGVYEITGIRDAVCPGSLEPPSNTFEVRWIPRPAIQVAESPTLQILGGRYLKHEVCEGDEDAVDIVLTGTPPYHVKFEQHSKPDRGSPSLRHEKISPGLGAASVRMETSQAGSYEYKFIELGDRLYDHDRRRFTPLVLQQKVNSRPSAQFLNAGRTYSYCKEEEAGDEVVPITLTGAPPFYLEIGIKHHATTKPEIINIPHVESHHYNLHIPHRVLALGTHVVTVRKVRDSRGCQRKTEYDGSTINVNVADIPIISPLEITTDYCVGDRISYTLSGTPPFNVFYTFGGVDRKAVAPTTNFRRIAEKPGNFTITGVSDKASTDACKAKFNITKLIHELPSVRISKGRTAEVDIHEGGEAEILFEFGGTPPFEFTYTRSTNVAKGKRSQLLETKSDVSYEYTKSVRASQEGTYEVVSIKDRYCGFTTQRVQGKPVQQLLTFR